MRYLPKVVAACLLGALFAAPVAADHKDRYKDALKHQREQQKRYEKWQREDQKRYEKQQREAQERYEDLARDERKRYERRLKEDQKRQREFERDIERRGGSPWPANYPQFPQVGTYPGFGGPLPGVPWAPQPVVPGYPWR